MDEMKPLVRAFSRGIAHVSTSKNDWVMRTRRVVKETMQERCNDETTPKRRGIARRRRRRRRQRDEATTTKRRRSDDDDMTRRRRRDDATTKKKKSNFGLMKLKWIFCNEKKILFLFLGHNVPITWSEVLGVNRRNEALGQSFTQRYSTCR